jgi:hypothetical protein
MFPKFSRFLTIAALTTFTCVIVSPSSAKPSHTDLIAQATTNADDTEIVETEVVLTTPDLIDKMFNYHSGDFFEKSSNAGFLNSMFGLKKQSSRSSYPENNVAMDGFLLNVIITDYFKQLQEGSPMVRTRDVESPFQDSIRTNPAYLSR